MFGADDEDWQIYRKLVRRICFLGVSLNLTVLSTTEHGGCILG